jgi:hypothetical protein
MRQINMKSRVWRCVRNEGRQAKSGTVGGLSREKRSRTKK